MKETSSALFCRGCGAVVRAVTSNTRDPWFESQHQQCSRILNVLISQLQLRKDESEEKEARN